VNRFLHGLIGHDWQHVSPSKIVCLDCKRIEVLVDSGGEWEEWVETGEADRIALRREERDILAREIAANANPRHP
jgi:hypothetical protein